MNRNLKNHGNLLNSVSVDFSSVPLAEYPRPQFQRDSYLCLNGGWDYTISKSEELPKTYSGKILVPYALESSLSGVNRLLEPNEILYYHRVVNLPFRFRKGKVLLHFEGVDQIAEIYINGLLCKRHIGGYTSFEVEVPFGVGNHFDLVVKVKDTTDSSYHSRGKQTLNPHMYSYTSSSGIYKPVWMESVPFNYLESVSYTSLYEERCVRVLVKSKEDTALKIQIGEIKVQTKTNTETIVPLLPFRPWSKEEPYLYPVTLETENDKVTSYYAIRKLSIASIQGFPRILLNDKPIFLSGLLDQGYYFQSNLTPKDYSDYEKDIQFALSRGFNCLRIHVKTECPYFYYLADKMGIYLIQDFPNGGEPYSFLATVFPRLIYSYGKEKHIREKKLGRGSKEGKQEFLAEAKEYLNAYQNHPSVLIYTIFNEGWGEFSPSEVYRSLKPLAKDKLLDTASGWYDAKSDFFSIHTYTFPLLKRKNDGKRPYILSEMGGVSYKVEGHSFFPGIFGHGKVKTQKKLTSSLLRLYEKKIIPQIQQRGLNMAIYTEIADCETEYNGLLTYDREVEKVDAKILLHIQDEIQKAFQASLKGKADKEKQR